MVSLSQISLRLVDMPAFNTALANLTSNPQVDLVKSILTILAENSSQGPCHYPEIAVVWFKVNDTDQEGNPRSEHRFHKVSELTRKVSDAITTLNQNPTHTAFCVASTQLIQKFKANPTAFKQEPSSPSTVKILEGGFSRFRILADSIQNEANIIHVEQALKLLSECTIQKGSSSAWVICISPNFCVGLECCVTFVIEAAATHGFSQESDYLSNVATLLNGFVDRYSLPLVPSPAEKVLPSLGAFETYLTNVKKTPANAEHVKAALTFLSSYVMQKDGNICVIYISPHLYLPLGCFIDKIEDAVDKHAECTDTDYYCKVELLMSSFKDRYSLDAS